MSGRLLSVEEEDDRDPSNGVSSDGAMVDPRLGV